MCMSQYLCHTLYIRVLARIHQLPIKTTCPKFDLRCKIILLRLRLGKWAQICAAIALDLSTWTCSKFTELLNQHFLSSTSIKSLNAGLENWSACPKGRLTYQKKKKKRDFTSTMPPWLSNSTRPQHHWLRPCCTYFPHFNKPNNTLEYSCSIQLWSI